MGLIDKIKNKVKKEEKSSTEDTQEKSTSYQDIISIIQSAGKTDANGNLKSIDMKLIKQKHIIEIVKKNKSLDEQNKILSKYLQEMVKENEVL